MTLAWMVKYDAKLSGTRAPASDDWASCATIATPTSTARRTLAAARSARRSMAAQGTWSAPGRRRLSRRTGESRGARPGGGRSDARGVSGRDLLPAYAPAATEVSAGLGDGDARACRPRTSAGGLELDPDGLRLRVLVVRVEALVVAPEAR